MTSLVKGRWDIADNTFDEFLSKEAVFCFVFNYVFVIDSNCFMFPEAGCL